MRLDEIDELGLWRGEAIVERMIRMHAVAVGGGAALTGDDDMAQPEAQTKAQTEREQQLSQEWGGGKVTEEPAAVTETPQFTKTTKTTTIRWQGANKPKA